MPPKYYVHENDDENWRLAQGSEVIRQASMPLSVTNLCDCSLTPQQWAEL